MDQASLKLRPDKMLGKKRKKSHYSNWGETNIFIFYSSDCKHYLKPWGAYIIIPRPAPFHQPITEDKAVKVIDQDILVFFERSIKTSCKYEPVVPGIRSKILSIEPLYEEPFILQRRLRAVRNDKIFVITTEK